MAIIKPITTLPLLKKKKSQEQLSCEAKGGRWDGKVCILPKELKPVQFPSQPKPGDADYTSSGQEGFDILTGKGVSSLPRDQQTPKPPPTPPKLDIPEVIRDQETGRITGIRLPSGKDILGVSEQEIRDLAQKHFELGTDPPGTVPAGTAQARAEQRATGQQLAGQVGQIDPSTGITPTGLSQTEALTQGVVGSIPSAIRMAGQFGIGAAVLGGAAGTAVLPGAGTAVGAGGGAIIGAAIGFVSGITGGMISNMKGQRVDDTNAQQRVLDEGKQTLKDWSTLAKADPANREFYLGQFNLQLQLIQDAHVQMITDTNADVAKFESAVPNLAEFSTFYSIGGERDALVNDMINSLQTPVTTEYEMMALTERRNK